MHTDEKEFIVFLGLATLIILLLALLIISLLFYYRKKQINYFKDFETLKLTHTKNILQTQIEIQENTFQHISKEIHDNINLSLTLAKLNLNMIADSKQEEIGIKTSDAIELITKSIEDLNNLSKGLNTDVIKSQGLINAIEKDIEKLKKLEAFKVFQEINGEPVFLDAEKELIIFRIVQESFNNIIKHSQAKHIWLILNYKIDQIEIIIKDDGRGFENSSQKLKGSGLINIESRAKVLNGIAEIKSKLGNGTSVNVTIPY